MLVDAILFHVLDGILEAGNGWIGVLHDAEVSSQKEAEKNSRTSRGRASNSAVAGARKVCG